MKINFVKMAGVAGIALLVLGARAQEKKESGEAHKIVRFGDLKWTSIIKGCDLAVVAGDPNAEGGAFVVRLRCEDGAKVPAHWHPTDEHVTVISGALGLGMGDKVDRRSSKMLTAGGYGIAPANMHHFAWTKTGAIVQVHLMGPFAITYVNPADDPSHGK